jgi:hypothetical protein
VARKPLLPLPQLLQLLPQLLPLPLPLLQLLLPLLNVVARKPLLLKHLLK